MVPVKRGSASNTVAGTALTIAEAHPLSLPVLRLVGSGKRRTFARAETKLNQWMAENARVSRVETDNPVALEEHLIKTLVLPLNLDQNDRSAFHAELSELRKKAKARAMALSVAT